MTLGSLALGEGPADICRGAAGMGSSTCREGLLRGTMPFAWSGDTSIFQGWGWGEAFAWGKQAHLCWFAPAGKPTSYKGSEKHSSAVGIQ